MQNVEVVIKAAWKKNLGVNGLKCNNGSFLRTKTEWLE